MAAAAFFFAAFLSFQLSALKLAILHTNDHHGRFYAKDGEYGMPARKTLIERLRRKAKADGYAVLVLSGGDINTGTVESDFFDAEPDFKGMESIGYDAMAVGNHEFDNLGGRFETAMDKIRWQRSLVSFPFLSANIFTTDATGMPRTRPFPGHKIFQKQGMSIAVVGLTTADTPELSESKNTKNLIFANPVQVAAPLVSFLKTKLKADFVIGLTHMGHYQNGEHGRKALGDVTLAKKVKGFNVIVGGHSATKLDRPDKVGETLIVQAKDWGKYVGELRVSFRRKHKGMSERLIQDFYKLHPVNLKNEDGSFQEARIEEDDSLKRELQPYLEQAREELANKIVGKLSAPLTWTKMSIRGEQHPMGTLSADAILGVAEGTDLAMTNGGGIRGSDLSRNVGLYDLKSVFPFGNTIVTALVQGDELVRLIDRQINLAPGNGGFIQLSSNVRVIYSSKQDPTITINGSVVEHKKDYRIATNSFSASGKEGFPNLSERPSYVDTGYDLIFALRTYLKKQGPVVDVESLKQKSARIISQ